MFRILAVFLALSGTVVAEADLTPGKPSFVDGPSPDGRFAVHLEDDRDAAWFTALDPKKDGEKSLDSVRIWMSPKVEKGAPTKHVEIRWSSKAAVAGLAVDGELVAVLDFEHQRAYAKAEQPPGDGAWGARAWGPEADAAFQ